MTDSSAACFGEHSDLRLEGGALVFPMPVTCYDQLMDGKSLPRGASYNGPRGTMEVDAVPNGRYHDPRAAALYHFLLDLRRPSGVRAHAGTTAPVEGPTGDRRHPDAQLFVSAAKLATLRTASRPAPVPDLVIEVDTTPLSQVRERERLAAYRRLGVPEVWTWRRTGDTEATPEGRAAMFLLADDRYEQLDTSHTVPDMAPRHLEYLLREPDDLARDEHAERLAARLAKGFGRRWSP